MEIRFVSFGTIEIDGRRYEHDVILDAGAVRKRRKGPSKAYRGRFGHTPLSVEEPIPWAGKRLVVGTGATGQLPIMPEVYEEARRRHVRVVALPTAEACDLLREADAGEAAAILHVTC
jgi:hypothetical protein